MSRKWIWRGSALCPEKAIMKNKIFKLEWGKSPSNAIPPRGTLACPIGGISSEEIECYVVEHEKRDTGFVNNGFDRAMEGREERTGGTSRRRRFTEELANEPDGVEVEVVVVDVEGRDTD